VETAAYVIEENNIYVWMYGGKAGVFNMDT
jgi:hypothetical protein